MNKKYTTIKVTIKSRDGKYIEHGFVQPSNIKKGEFSFFRKGLSDWCKLDYWKITDNITGREIPLTEFIIEEKTPKKSNSK